MTTGSIKVADLAGHVGQEIGLSPWRTVTQDIINKFAVATDDDQFIHTDPARAAETPFGGTIAHGFLVLSLLSAMTYETLPSIEKSKMAINQGFDKLRFQTPVRSDARIRTRFVLADVNIRPSGMVQLAYDVTIEVEGSAKPALTARWLTISVLDPEDVRQ